jgi:uncharacterized LabA/DUF88 family protein
VTNYAFIDGQNLYSGIKTLGWRLDHRKFREYLARHYGVTRAFYFIGYIDSQQTLYIGLQRAGYELVFKPVVQGRNHIPKGNVDAELVLNAMIEYLNYDQAVLVTGDGDFGCLVEYLEGQGKLRMVLAPNRAFCSSLLKRTAKGRLHFVENIRHLVEKQ